MEVYSHLLKSVFIRDSDSVYNIYNKTLTILLKPQQRTSLLISSALEPWCLKSSDESRVTNDKGVTKQPKPTRCTHLLLSTLSFKLKALFLKLNLKIKNDQ